MIPFTIAVPATSSSTAPPPANVPPPLPRLVGQKIEP
jgi:hypothetical protein